MATSAQKLLCYQSLNKDSAVSNNKPYRSFYTEFVSLNLVSKKKILALLYLLGKSVTFVIVISVSMMMFVTPVASR